MARRSWAGSAHIVAHFGGVAANGLDDVVYLVEHPLAGFVIDAFTCGTFPQ
jgi:hypothetical protein